MNTFLVSHVAQVNKNQVRNK